MSHPSSSSLFLTFEGIDGAGKSSHLAAAQDFFSALGRRVVMTREPGGTPLAEALREMVLRDPMDPLTEALLIFAARRDHLMNVIQPALQRGDVVLCDRFTDSTFAYQGHGRQFPLEVLEQLERWVQGSLQPDLTLWFDLRPEVAAARLSASRAPDRFESEQLSFFIRVRHGYAVRAAAFPARFLKIDAEGEKFEIWKRIESVLTALAGRRFARG
jgi:dTMP kinase